MELKTEMFLLKTTDFLTLGKCVCNDVYVVQVCNDVKRVDGTLLRSC